MYNSQSLHNVVGSDTICFRNCSVLLSVEADGPVCSV